jgi:myosin V
MAESYDVGTRAWQTDPTEGWVASEVVKKNVEGAKTNLVFKLDNGGVSPLVGELWSS